MTRPAVAPPPDLSERTRAMETVRQWMCLDVWLMLGRPSEAFPAPVTDATFADLWAEMMHSIALLSGVAAMSEPRSAAERGPGTATDAFDPLDVAHARGYREGHRKAMADCQAATAAVPLDARRGEEAMLAALRRHDSAWEGPPHKCRHSAHLFECFLSEYARLSADSEAT